MLLWWYLDLRKLSLWRNYFQVPWSIKQINVTLTRWLVIDYSALIQFSWMISEFACIPRSGTLLTRVKEIILTLKRWIVNDYTAVIIYALRKLTFWKNHFWVLCLPGVHLQWNKWISQLHDDYSMTILCQKYFTVTTVWKVYK